MHDLPGKCSWGKDTAPRKPRTEAHFEALRKRADALQAYLERLEGMLAKDYEELTMPTQALKLDDRLGNLIHYGGTSSPFRFGNKPPAKFHEFRRVVENPDVSYVLQLDGVDISQTHPDIDWSRHLPPEVTLDRRQHDKYS
ncbi:hypothetical protein B0H14DRAFT_3690245 [Mycena olivaceomarginata]|nr:hypothetical protein B0H14DRAFT_3690245 [Mycena olivaceomarginata]